MTRFHRTEMVLGKEALQKLKSSRLAVFGVGGVGGYAAEALARCGVGRIDLIDNDKISESNINRQIIALSSTVGRFKTEVMKERIEDINPSVEVTEHRIFYLPETEFDFGKYDYIIDAIDTVSAKIALAVRAKEAGVPLISSMGTGNKLNIEGFKVTDIYKTKTCPLARVMRRELKKRGIERLKVVYSEEEPVETAHVFDGDRRVPGSVSFVPPVAGLMLAREVILDLLYEESNL